MKHLHQSSFVNFFLYTLLSLSENSGCLTSVRLQQPQEQRYPILQVHAGSFRVLTFVLSFVDIFSDFFPIIGGCFFRLLPYHKWMSFSDFCSIVGGCFFSDFCFVMNGCLHRHVPNQGCCWWMGIETVALSLVECLYRILPGQC